MARRPGQIRVRDHDSRTKCDVPRATSRVFLYESPSHPGIYATRRASRGRYWSGCIQPMGRDGLYGVPLVIWGFCWTHSLERGHSRYIWLSMVSGLLYSRRQYFPRCAGNRRHALRLYFGRRDLWESIERIFPGTVRVHSAQLNYGYPKPDGYSDCGHVGNRKAPLSPVVAESLADNLPTACPWFFAGPGAGPSTGKGPTIIAN